MVRDASKFGLPSNIKWREIDQSVVILNVTDGSYYSLNETAQAVFKHAIADMDVDGIVKSIFDEFEGDEADFRRDAITLLEELVSEKILDIKT